MTIDQASVRTLDVAGTGAYAHLFQTLGEPTRLAVLQHLATGEHRVRDLVEHIGLAQSTISKHLRFLLECRLVVVRIEGRASWYALAVPEETSALVNAAEVLLKATGTDASLHPHLHRSPEVAPARPDAA